jgi:hypothetical protein
MAMDVSEPGIDILVNRWTKKEARAAGAGTSHHPGPHQMKKHRYADINILLPNCYTMASSTM